jgi:hypothetical protein
MLRCIFSLSLILITNLVLSAELTPGGTIVIHSRQGLMSLGSGDGADTSNYDLELTGQHVTNDILYLQFSVPLVQGALTSLSSQIICDRLSINSDSVVFGYLAGDESAGLIQYRLIQTNNGSATADFSSAGLHCVTPPVKLQASALSDLDEATLTVEITSGYGVVMESTAPVPVASIIDSYSASVNTYFDETVEVATSGRSFVGGQVTNSSDALDLTLTLTNGTNGDLLAKSSAAAHSVSAGGASAINPQTSGTVFTVEGDFSFLDTSSAESGMQLGDNTVTIPNFDVAFTDSFFALTGSNLDNPNVVAGNNTTLLTIDKRDVDGVIPKQEFTGQVEVYFNNNAKSVVLPFLEGLGAWGWNGSEVWIYAMPFDENVSRSIGVSNQGNYSFNVTATVHYQETIYGPYQLGAAAASAVTQFGEKLDQSISEAGDLITTGRGNVVLQLSAAEANTMIYGGYKVDSDLTFVNLITSAQTNIVTP